MYPAALIFLVRAFILTRQISINLLVIGRVGIAAIDCSGITSQSLTRLAPLLIGQLRTLMRPITRKPFERDCFRRAPLSSRQLLKSFLQLIRHFKC